MLDGSVSLDIALASLSANKAYGSDPLLGWMVDRNITPYIPVIDLAFQCHALFTRDAFATTARQITCLAIMALIAPVGSGFTEAVPLITSPAE